MISDCKVGDFGQIGRDSTLRKQQDRGRRTHGHTANIHDGLELPGPETADPCGVHGSRTLASTHIALRSG